MVILESRMEFWVHLENNLENVLFVSEYSFLSFHASEIEQKSEIERIENAVFIELH